MKIIHYNPTEDTFKSYSLDKFKLIVLPIVLVAVLLVFGLGFSIFYYQYQESSQLRTLKRQNMYMTGIITQLQKKSTTLQSQINQIKTQSARLSEFAELPIVDAEDWDIGSGGGEYVVGMEEYITDNKLKDQIFTTDRGLDKVQKQISWLYSELKAIEDKFNIDQTLRVHYPSIAPVQKGIITSGYGVRHDPFTGEKKQHNGLDFFAKNGTQVIATADGVVEMARDVYSPNQALGKLVIINHGSGIKTRYGHLGSIKVKKGQRVKRHQVIGTIGNTGRSTGPHLHYEVLKYNKHKNPYYFVLE